jgi:hypothetical protein
MAELPLPPVPIDANLTHFDDMPLEVRRFRDSAIAGANAEVFRCSVLLWCAAWHQIPAGSLPSDDAELCRLVGLGRDLRTWRKLRKDVLRGWRQFSDSRLYHRVVCEKVIGALNSSQSYEWNKACARVRKENNRNAKQIPKLPKIETPTRPDPLMLQWPDDDCSLPVRVTERELDSEVTRTGREYETERKGKERKGKERIPFLGERLRRTP